MKTTTEPRWRTSTFSDGLQCVEVARVGDGVAMRHSKDPHGPVLNLSRAAMGDLLARAKAGQFDDLT